MFEPSSKKVLLGVLVACFAVQTVLVYSDERGAPLSEPAIRGRRLYHRHSCHVCHQIYGQGGFLGPDLTNAASRVDDSRLASLLTVGSGQMPALGFSPDEIADLGAFLEEIDRPELGYGQLRLGDPEAETGPHASFESAVRAAAPPPAAAAGFAAYSSRACAACHLPFAVSPAGAPDLSLAAQRLDPVALRGVLTAGRPDRGMPRPTPSFSSNELEGIVAWLRWLNDERVGLEADTRRGMSERPVTWSRLPWWEFR